MLFFFSWLFLLAKKKKIKISLENCVPCRSFSFFFCFFLCSFFFSICGSFRYRNAKRRSKIFFSFFFGFGCWYLRLTQCVCLCAQQKRCKKWRKKNFHFHFFGVNFHLPEKHFLLKKSPIFYFRKWPSRCMNSKMGI